MNRFEATSSLRKSYSNEPRRTLSFVDVADNDHNEEHSISEITHVDRHKSRTEKSVHFADEEESIADDATSLTSDSVASGQSSQHEITWLPSEHLYSDDTFIKDTETTAKEIQSHDPTTTIATVPSYGSSTFVHLDSDDEDKHRRHDNASNDNTDTDTEQLYSYTDSFVSSDVFSGRSVTNNTTPTYKEWKDVTEIVKDIEELEESEFVTRVDSLDFDHKEGEDTEASESLDEELAEFARQEFLAFAMRRLRLKEVQSPRSLAVDSITSGLSQGQGYRQSINDLRSRLSGTGGSKEERQFCLKMLRRCQQKENKPSPTPEPVCVHPLYAEVERQRDQPLEYYGLNSALIERLKLENLQNAMEKKSQDLDQDISQSKGYVKTITQNATIAKDQFVSQMCSRVRRENMEEAIQAHLIRLHPVTQFAEFVKDLPKPDENMREILYKYKRQLEHRKMTSSTNDVP